MHEQKILDANDGDVDAAKWLICEFRASFRRDPNGLPRGKMSGFPTEREERLLDYVVDCFDKFFGPSRAWDRNANATDALNLISHGRTGPKSTKSRNFSLGVLVAARHALEKSLPPHSSVGESPLERAILFVAEDEGQTFDTVRRGYKEYKAMLKAVL